MNEPQVWTLISVFSVAMFGMFGLVSGLFTQVVRAEIGKVAVQVKAVDQRVDSLRHEVNARIDGLDQRMDSLRREVNGRIDGLSVKFDAVVRDVQAIARRVFPETE